MLTDIFFWIVGAILGIIGIVLSTLTSIAAFFTPTFVTDGLNQFFGGIAVFQGILPLVATDGAPGLAGQFGIIDVFGFTITFATAWFLFIAVRWLLGMVPFARIKA